MLTIYEEIDPEGNNQEIFEQACAILQKGGLVAFPTETVYGLGGNALDPKASEKIYAAKGRPSDNPLIVHIAEEKDLEKLCDEIPDAARKLAKEFWPGPLTMIMKKKDIVPRTTTGGLDTVAVRMPKNETALQLIRSSGIYIAAPSANLSGRPSPTRAEHVLQDMDGRIDMIIDDGSVDIGIESTIVDLTEEIPKILRPGYITKEMLEKVVGTVEVDPAIAEGVHADIKPKAPGMKYRHYAPKGEMVVVEGSDMKRVVSFINELVEQKKREGKSTGILATNDNLAYYYADCVLNVGRREDLLSISNRLFDVLRRFDDEGCEFIASESFSRDNIGYAIMNRLMKAAGGRIINIDKGDIIE